MAKKKNNVFMLACTTVLIVALSVFIMSLSGCGKTENPPETDPPTSGTDVNPPVVIASNTDLTPSVIYPASGTDLTVALPLDLGDGLSVEQIGFYSGSASGENGLETVTGVLGLKLTNNSGKNISNARIVYGDYVFELSILPDGGSAMLPETTLSTYDGKLPTDSPAVESVEYLEAETIALDSFEFTVKEGQLIVKNVSDADIGGNLLVYYQYESIGGLLGDVCYSAALEGGIKAGESKTISAPNAIIDSTKVILVAVA